MKATELREYARRDWAAPTRSARRQRAALPVAHKVRLAIELYEATRATRPDWPDDATRRADLASHRGYARSWTARRMSALADTLAALAQSDLLPRFEQAIAEDQHP